MHSFVKQYKTTHFYSQDVGNIYVDNEGNFTVHNGKGIVFLDDLDHLEAVHEDGTHELIFDYTDYE